MHETLCCCWTLYYLGVSVDSCHLYGSLSRSVGLSQVQGKIMITAVTADIAVNWLLGLCSVLGNITVFVWRCRHRNEQRWSVLSILILHLAFFDLICGAHLVFFESVVISGVVDHSNGTFPYSAYVVSKVCYYSTILFIASGYTSAWVTLSIAIYSLGMIKHMRVAMIHIIGGILLLVTWMIFSASIIIQTRILDVPKPAFNVTAVLFCTFSTLLSYGEIEYILVFQCLSSGLVVICGGLYLLAFIPHIQQWRKNVQNIPKTTSLFGFHGRLLAVVFVNALCSLAVTSLMVSCSISIFENKTLNNEKCKSALSVSPTIIAVPPAINPFLYTIGTQRFLQLFSRLRSCFPRCICSNDIELGEQQRLLGQHNLCNVCCVICYTRERHGQSGTTESLQSSKLFTDSGTRVLGDSSFGLSSIVAYSCWSVRHWLQQILCLDGSWIRIEIVALCCTRLFALSW